MPLHSAGACGQRSREFASAVLRIARDESGLHDGQAAAVATFKRQAATREHPAQSAIDGRVPRRRNKEGIHPWV